MRLAQSDGRPQENGTLRWRYGQGKLYENTGRSLGHTQKGLRRNSSVITMISDLQPPGFKEGRRIIHNIKDY